MVQTISLILPDETATQKLAAILAQHIPYGVVYLVGDLGAGKTTLTRSWLQALGQQGNIKSPTYTLVEPYTIAGQPVYHFDLYRLQDPYELELMGIRDYLSPEPLNAQMNDHINDHTNNHMNDQADQNRPLLFIEWPQKGQPVIPPADYQIALTLDAQDQLTRHLILSTSTENRRWKAVESSVYEQFL